jgi:hypothetical protein
MLTWDIQFEAQFNVRGVAPVSSPLYGSGRWWSLVLMEPGAVETNPYGDLFDRGLLLSGLHEVT